MKINKNIGLTILLATLAMGSYAQSKGQLADEIIAKVDNYIVLKSELEGAHQQALANGNYSADLKCQIFSQLITQKLMIAKAEIDSVLVSPERVDANLDDRMRMIIQQTGGSEEQLEAYYGKSLQQIRSEVRDDVKEQLVVREMQSHITGDINVTPAEIKKFFNNIPKDSIPFFSTEVQVGQIVRIPEVGKPQMDAAYQKLIALRSRIENGENFETLAREYSQGPSGRSGGNLGFVKRGAMVPEYEAGALALKAGELSDPIESEFGVHLIQMIERRGNEYNSRHILMQPAPSVSDIQVSTDYLDSLRTLIVNDSMAFEKVAKENSDDKYTGANCGYFMDGSGASQISVENLDPVIYLTITDSLSIGEISDPMYFRTDDGKDAVRIIYYKSKVKPHEANLEQDWQKIQAATLNEKKNSILSKWFIDAREDVFIDIDKTYDHCNILRN
jgi:peptidyl-prolyl cis-trans isomerase SurA